MAALSANAASGAVRYLGVIAIAAAFMCTASALASDPAPPETQGGGDRAQSDVAMVEHGQAAEPANAAQMRALINNIWADVSRSWRTMAAGGLSEDSAPPHVNIVPKVSAAHCYGLYVGAGPVYCSGNGTVFVSLDEMTRLGDRFGAMADAGIAFLIAHEFGHHVQFVNGRFDLLARMVREEPERRRELSVRFELEADCLAGMWAVQSPTFAAGETTRTEMLTSLNLVGDDKVQLAAFGTADPTTFWHGTSDQRTRWFLAGQHAANLEGCDVLSAAPY